MTRIDDLRALRDQIDAEIDAETQRIARIHTLKAKANAALTRGTLATRVTTICARHFDVTIDDILGTCRVTEIVNARSLTCFLLRSAGTTYAEIGRQLERDHSTIIHSCRRVERSRELQEVAAYLVGLLDEAAA